MKNMFKFISYSGKYPNLCGGVLIFEFEGKEYNTVSRNDNGTIFDKTMGFNPFSPEDTGENYTQWIVQEYHIKDLEKLIGREITKGEMLEFQEMLNENIEKPCCGGCR